MFKKPVAGPVALGTEGIEGDQQADRRVHGGPDKAVHLYPARHYRTLAAHFPEASDKLVIGAMGENLSTPDLDETEVRIGDVWQLGSSQLQLCQPRNPCWKIDERFASPGMAAFIDKHLLTGWYFRVLQAGLASPGDGLQLLQPAADAPSLSGAMTLWRQHRPSLAALQALAATPGIASVWRDKILQRLKYLETLTRS